MATPRKVLAEMGLREQSIPAPTIGENETVGGLVAETSADGNALAPYGAAAAEHGCAGLGLHACAETMCLHALTAVGLKCALGHKNALLFSRENLRLDGKY
jgi:hypothetical protein